MSIISKMDRRSPWGRFVISLIFFFLTLGGLTILYPFALMISGSVRSEMDETQLNFVPRYLVDTHELYRKFLEFKYNQNVEALNRAHLTRTFRFAVAEAPEEVNPARVDLFRSFVEDVDIPEFWWRLGGTQGRLTIPANARLLRERVAAFYDYDLDRFRQETGVITDSWLGIIFPPPEWMSRLFAIDRSAVYERYMELLKEAPLAEIDFAALDGHFLENLIYPRYGRTGTALFNQAHPETPLESYSDFVLPSRVPPEAHAGFRARWIEYVQEEINASFVKVDAAYIEAFHAQLQEQHGAIGNLNQVWGTSFADFADIPLPDGRTWLTGGIRADYEDFLRHVTPEAIQLVGPQFAWQDWLLDKFGSLSAINEAMDLEVTAVEQIRMPVAEIEFIHVTENTGALRRQFAKQNYVNVIDTLFTHGRTFMNTVIYCVAVVGLNLLINPMAAYALSRFKLKGTYKILLILMATSAFPPMVTLIPQFVILQNLNLMNTFIALILPTLANGYLVFLLKGFFDSLPQDLYDAAMIDGASEVRVFFQITMALSKPILAVVALQSFNAAYTAFLYPLLVAPDPDMWLISVWLYQFQQQSSMSGVFASVLIASIPTIVIFLVAQNIILRGIAVPVEK